MKIIYVRHGGRKSFNLGLEKAGYPFLGLEEVLVDTIFRSRGSRKSILGLKKVGNPFYA